MTVDVIEKESEAIAALGLRNAEDYADRDIPVLQGSTGMSQQYAKTCGGRAAGMTGTRHDMRGRDTTCEDEIRHAGTSRGHPGDVTGTDCEGGAALRDEGQAARRRLAAPWPQGAGGGGLLRRLRVTHGRGSGYPRRNPSQSRASESFTDSRVIHGHLSLSRTSESFTGIRVIHGHPSLSRASESFTGIRVFHGHPSLSRASESFTDSRVIHAATASFTGIRVIHGHPRHSRAPASFTGIRVFHGHPSHSCGIRVVHGHPRHSRASASFRGFRVTHAAS